MKQQKPSFQPTRYLHPSYWLLWVGLGMMWLIAQLPYRVQMALGSLLGWLMYHFIPARRRIAAINLELCFPEKTAAERAQLLRRHFDSLGKGTIETAMAWWTPARRLQRLQHVEGLEHLEAALQAGKGAILLSAHFTSLELGGRLLALHVPFHVMYREHRNPLFEAVMRSRRENNFERAHERQDIRRIIGSLKAGMPVWYAPDQDYGRKHSVFAPFFGVPAAMITATARFARISGAPVVPFFPQRLPDGSGYVLRLQPALEHFPSGDDIADATRINKIIEAEILRQPEQYLWVHRRFKTRPAGEARPYPKRKRRQRRKRAEP
ncbi:LpxL/LpxP family Kdo(2)-lipid IV(A) lauroyl/palmitoleoyl acyltransferase [Sulfuriflexus sp.]|uniref:LpxL/LpxP family Kdo(2)-lipid IV(A) lauroyl/palmitoleoyl acyltransferase n=1 Tax=Sulfuriflexus sp. TaxID=2015443 RepID=UPI0028CDE712|nr:LpxL/LpxP family Kdo(2)-lipid IV(A) lauroyl/palmitoleoyl acyltransferase [Sulfuriflexus sp.]MDT8404851.1 LpxL/LpxP family Kdo(2)-lipid IV(A) lauroyl/palmitoleoyl acyltransferase [Sulfuriflexus sp.]